MSLWTWPDLMIYCQQESKQNKNIIRGYKNAELEKKGILNPNDLAEMERRWGTWAAHLAVAQEKPKFATRQKLFDRAKKLQSNETPYYPE